MRKGYPLYVWLTAGDNRVSVFSFESIIAHENVVYVELVRGEGVNGGDALVVGIQAFKPSPNVPPHYLTKDFGIRLNKYRFSMHIESLNVIGTNEVVESKLGNRVRYSFSKPVNMLIKMKYSLNGVSITIVIK